MSLVGLNIVVLDGANYPSMVFIAATGVSIAIDSDSPILDSAVASVTVDNTNYHTVTITKSGYSTYTNTFLITDIVPDPGDYNLFVSLTSSANTNACQYITITKGECHNFTFVNSGTNSSNDVTFSITDLDNNPIIGYTDIVLNYGSTAPFVSLVDNIYIATIKDTSETIICKYVIIDDCSILNCYKNKYLKLICDCDCNHDDCTDYCKLDYEMKRLHLLWFDLFNRII